MTTTAEPRLDEEPRLDDEPQLGSALANGARRAAPALPALRGLTLVERYDYTDEDGELLFVAARYIDREGAKTFRQARLVDGVWRWNIDGARRVLYRLPRVIEHIEANGREPLYVVEGEKDVLAVEAAGAVATCNPMGAGKWTDEHAEALQGARRVVVVADRDDPGLAHARIVAESLAAVGVTAEVVQAAAGKDAADHLAAGYGLDAFERLEDPEPAPAVAAPRSARTVDGWTFVRADAETMPAVWGDGDAVAWARGEPLMIAGPDGVGKTAVAQQLALARIRGGSLLGFTVAKSEGRLLYLAADRPKQAARSMRRMVTNTDEQLLRDRLVVHRGPLPFDVVKEPVATFRTWIEEHGASDVFVDSLKDLAPELTKDEVGSTVNRAFQEISAAGIELVVCHHQRKQQQGVAPPRRISDVYGSRWLTAGMGSIVLLWGEPGDLVVAFRHLKQPLEEIGPFDVIHDHVHGRTTLHDQTDLEQILGNATNGLVCKEAARILTHSDDPKPNDVEKARRRLESLVARNRAERRDDPDGLARYYAKEPA